MSAKQYRLKSNPKLVQLGFASVILVFAAIWIFGFVGFYFIDKKHFGFSFNTWQSLKLSAANFLLVGQDDLFPKTKLN